MMKFIMRDLSSQRFGRLIAICPTKKRQNEKVVWLCRCDCGNLITVISTSLTSNHTKSCGCFNSEKAKERATNNKWGLKHGDATRGEKTRLYQCWIDMKTRGSSSNRHNYNSYAKRGITVCDKWKNSYLAFKTWALSNGYADNLTIDRINNDGDYTPDNCHWITRSENSKRPKYKKRKEDNT